MIKYIFSCLIIIVSPFAKPSSFAQSYTITKKSCGKCGNQVSQYAKVGDKCPYCGVIWGTENSKTSTSTRSSTYPNASYGINTTPSQSLKKLESEEVDDSKASKYETEQWILSKLTKYTKKEFYLPWIGSPMTESTHEINNITYSFDNYNIVISYAETVSSPINDIFENKNRKSNTTYYNLYIPIYDIDKVYDYNYELVFTTSKETMIEHNIQTNRNWTKNYFSLEFDTKAEVDLGKRISKAFLHLKSFYKKPISKELF